MKIFDNSNLVYKIWKTNIRKHSFVFVRAYYILLTNTRKFWSKSCNAGSYLAKQSTRLLVQIPFLFLSLTFSSIYLSQVFFAIFQVNDNKKGTSFCLSVNQGYTFWPFYTMHYSEWWLLTIGTKLCEIQSINWFTEPPLLIVNKMGIFEFYSWKVIPSLSVQIVSRI